MTAPAVIELAQEVVRLVASPSGWRRIGAAAESLVEAGAEAVVEALDAL